jgi:hypothetical protein
MKTWLAAAALPTPFGQTKITDQILPKANRPTTSNAAHN